MALVVYYKVNKLIINDQFSFGDVVLESKNGKFLYMDLYDKVYEMREEDFRKLLVLEAGLMHVEKNHRFEFMWEQLVLTEDLFTAQLYDYDMWTMGEE